MNLELLLSFVAKNDLKSALSQLDLFEPQGKNGVVPAYVSVLSALGEQELCEYVTEHHFTDDSQIKDFYEASYSQQKYTLCEHLIEMFGANKMQRVALSQRVEEIENPTKEDFDKFNAFTTKLQNLYPEQKIDKLEWCLKHAYLPAFCPTEDFFTEITYVSSYTMMINHLRHPEFMQSVKDVNWTSSFCAEIKNKAMSSFDFFVREKKFPEKIVAILATDFEHFFTPTLSVEPQGYLGSALSLNKILECKAHEFLHLYYQYRSHMPFTLDNREVSLNQREMQKVYEAYHGVVLDWPENGTIDPTLAKSVMQKFNKIPSETIEKFLLDHELHEKTKSTPTFKL